MHQSTPAAPSPPPSPPRQPPRADPRTLAFFLPWMANSRGWGLVSRQIPRGGDEKRAQMPRPLSARTVKWCHLSILMCDFSFQLTSL